MDRTSFPHIHYATCAGGRVYTWQHTWTVIWAFLIKWLDLFSSLGQNLVLLKPIKLAGGLIYHKPLALDIFGLSIGFGLLLLLD